jgi:hydroxymethylpyrimidine pyrophosphatase-like HAD family hydrolase
MPALVLASDLDGTLAGGTAADRATLITELEAAAARLIYVTGRTPDAVRDIMDEAGLPVPEVLIADVGTSVLHGIGPARVAPIETDIAARWPGTDVVARRLERIPGLARQDVRAPYRVSWWIEPVRRLRGSRDEYAARAPDDVSLAAPAAALAADVVARANIALAGLDVDIVLSANVFVDVLPRGVNKGTTLRRVLSWLAVADAHCVVAGDSLNDLALFETGIRAIVVGNCEPALRARMAEKQHVYCSNAAGAAGVLDGLRHYGYLAPRGGRPAHGQ